MIRRRAEAGGEGAPEELQVGRKYPQQLFAFLVLGMLVCVQGCGEAPALRRLPDDAVILAFGDSLTLGDGVDRRDSYPSVLARATGLSVINAGVPGEVTARGVARLPRLLGEHSPDLVILCHGANDILLGYPMDIMETNLREMVRASREMGADVVMVAVPRFDRWGSAPSLYERVAHELEVPIEAKALVELERDRDMKSDAVHLNQLGYLRLAEAIAELLGHSGAI